MARAGKDGNGSPRKKGGNGSGDGAPGPRATRRRKAPEPSGPLPADVAAGEQPPQLEALARRVQDDGGTVLARYRDPWGGRWLLLAALPLEKVSPTPFQRELSDPHVKRLAAVIPKVGRYLDPVVAVPAPGGWWTPNGMHRLAAMRELGARAIVALAVAEREVALRILALNTEKAHNLKDRSLEAARMLRSLAASPDTASRPEREWEFEFEEASLLSIGLAYEERPRFSGSAYQPVVRRCETLLDRSVGECLPLRQEHARRLLDLDDAVSACVAALREAGLQSAYLKPFVVARINPLRFARAAKPGQKAPTADFDATIGRMLKAARAFDASRIRLQDLAAMGGAPAEEPG